MNYLIIGSNSFSGSALVNFLLSKGHKVYCLSRSDDYDKVFLPFFTNKNKKNYFFQKADLNKNFKIISDLLNKIKFQRVVNFAAQGMVAESWRSPNDWYNTNLIAQTSLIDELRKHDCIEKYLHFTTPEVYGNTKKFIKEDSFFNPSTPYAISRAAFDMHLKAYYKNYNFPVIFTRTANVYGECQQLYRIVPKTIISVLLNEKIKLHGGGKSVRSFIHINDVCNALYKILSDSNDFGGTYHISTNEIISIKDLVFKIFDKMNVSSNDFIEVVGERDGKDQGYLLNSDKIRISHKWKENISLDSGINKTISWVKKNIDTLKDLPRVYQHKK